MIEEAMNGAHRRNRANRYLHAGVMTCLVACMSVHAAPPSGDIILARYTTQATMPEDTIENPLAVQVQIQFPRSEVQTVGDAVRYLLLRTGYSLVDAGQLDAAVEELFMRPLPESHRKLGPYSVESTLKVLMGKAFELRINHLNRTVLYLPVGSVAKAAERGAQQ